MLVNIYGAGISGLTVAQELVEKGYEVHIYEKDLDLGGMAKSRRTTENVPTAFFISGPSGIIIINNLIFLYLIFLKHQ